MVRNNYRIHLKISKLHLCSAHILKQDAFCNSFHRLNNLSLFLVNIGLHLYKYLYSIIQSEII